MVLSGMELDKSEGSDHGIEFLGFWYESSRLIRVSVILGVYNIYLFIILIF